eukprot:g5041.t1
MRILRPCITNSHRLCCTHSFNASAAQLIQSLNSTSTRKRPERVRTSAPYLFRQHDVRQPWPLSAWGQEVDFSPAKISSTEVVTSEIRSVKVDIGEGIRSYTKAGQFIQIRIGDSKPAFMAIASPPKSNDSQIQLIVKCSGDTATQLCELNQGDDVKVSEVMGKGFPIERIPSERISQILIFATGTGIAPIKALIDSSSFQIDKRESVKLFYGVRNEAECPVRSELEEWKNNLPSLDITVVYSEATGEYIQDVFTKLDLNFDPLKTGVILCGQREMCETITEFVKHRGVSSDHILLNF